jgi:hypothetical protein
VKLRPFKETRWQRLFQQAREAAKTSESTASRLKPGLFKEQAAEMIFQQR